MSSKERSSRPPKKKTHANRYTGSLATIESELLSQTTLPRSSTAQKPSVLQPEPAVGDEPLGGYRLFDIHPLVKFVEPFPCPTCQHSVYDVKDFGAVLFYIQGMWCYHELEKHSW